MELNSIDGQKLKPHLFKDGPILRAHIKCINSILNVDYGVVMVFVHTHNFLIGPEVCPVDPLLMFSKCYQFFWCFGYQEGVLEKLGKHWLPEKTFKNSTVVSLVFYEFYVIFFSQYCGQHKQSSIHLHSNGAAIQKKISRAQYYLEVKYLLGQIWVNQHLKVCTDVALSFMIYFAVSWMCEKGIEVRMWIRGWCSQVQSLLRCYMIISMHSAS